MLIALFSKRSTSLIVRILKEPLLHFLLLGMLIFGVHTYVQEETADTSHIVEVSAPLVQQLQLSWQRQWQRPPSEQELQNLIQSKIQEEILYREALNMGLDQDDTIIRRWLTQKIDFLSRDMIPPAEPTEAELQAYLEAHPEKFIQPAKVSFTHIFFNPDGRGEAGAQRDAEKALARLQAAKATPDRAPQLGDRFMLNYDYAQAEPLQVKQVFGSEFTDQLFELEPGTWQGPISSGFGTHLVRISDRIDEHQAAFDTVREDIRRTLMDERREAANEEFYRRLKQQYDITISADVLADHPDLPTVVNNDMRLNVDGTGAGLPMLVGG